MKILDVSDELWIRVHQKYEMSQIIQKYIYSKQGTDVTSMFPIMVNWINETMKLKTCNA